MKLLSVVVPCYNSQDYMRNCIESLLPGGEDVELLIVNDGSRDETAKIADEYATRYPTIVKAIHQENKGHGGAVNSGIQHASGCYLKVVDSDDWVDYDAYMKILHQLKSIIVKNETVDLLLSNFVFEKEGKKYKKVMKYENVFPQNTIFTWDEVGNFRKGQYIMMHSMIYRTELLRESGLKLPEHTFYVDNLFVFHPLQYVKTMMYLNENFYRYFIGRDDQSVNEKVMIKRIDQQLKVNKMMVDQFDVKKVINPRLRQYLINHLEIVTVISAIMLIRSGTEENLKKKEALWNYIEENNPELYQNLRYGALGKIMNIPGRIGRTITVGVYKISQKIVGFN
ncbi:glycosyltransferase family 2 protein [Fervidibacillus albus]|uniref:Glycosyltransferase family 2 protein n=1 Tax=Fervidibacillus albus TaxID=2980026 RepID=A0A9E8LTF9_9BACI|nr:glycosyltransferase family 2 protein [Fervidibacillus albus]WAA09065.1 glycosyltransferase family 2 protein [Fervidibacillus albus]